MVSTIDCNPSSRAVMKRKLSNNAVSLLEVIAAATIISVISIGPPRGSHSLHKAKMLGEFFGSTDG